MSENIRYGTWNIKIQRQWWTEDGFGSGRKGKTGWREDSYLKTHSLTWAFLVAQMVKNLPAMHKIWVQSLGRKNPLEKEMTTHSSILAWKISWTEEPGGLQSMAQQRVGHDWATNTSNFFQQSARGSKKTVVHHFRALILLSDKLPKIIILY